MSPLRTNHLWLAGLLLAAAFLIGPLVTAALISMVLLPVGAVELSGIYAIGALLATVAWFRIRKAAKP